MTTSLSLPPAVPAATAAWNLDTLFRYGGVGLLCGTTSSAIGGVWDIQWHQDVGPDTFFTAPHLFLYFGALCVGLTSLAVVLACTWLVGRGAARDAALVPLFRRTFWAPVGFVLAGCGAALYLVFGQYDLWWHTVYGFDAVLNSPPHTGLGLGDIAMLGGTVAVFALLVTRARMAVPSGAGWQAVLVPALGLALATAIFLINSASWQVSFIGAVVAGVDGQAIFVAALYAVALLAVASVVRRAGATMLVGLAFSLLVAAIWLFSTWATPAYAAALGLFPRDNAPGYPEILAVLPKFVLPAAAAIDLLLVVARRRNLPVRTGVLLAAGTGMAVLALGEIVVPTAIVVAPGWVAVATVAAAAVVGAGGGWLGWKLGVVLWRLSGAAPVAPVQATSAPGTAVARSAVGAVATILVVASLGVPASAVAAEGVAVVHRESVQVGPYAVAVGFSEWPMRADRSLDILFEPDGGIADKTGTITLIAPSGQAEERPLVRHPRQRDAWGLDIVALPVPGRWSLRFAIDGPDGGGVGRLPIALGARPGPPEIVGWLLPLLAGGAIAAAVAAAWRRVRPTSASETWAWE